MQDFSHSHRFGDREAAFPYTCRDDQACNGSGLDPCELSPKDLRTREI